MPGTPERIFEVTIDEAAAGGRLDKVLAGLVPDLSRARIQQLLADGNIVRLEAPRDATIENANTKVKQGETYRITVPAAADAEPEGEAIPLHILYEDDDLIVIDKAAGMVVHPAPGHSGGTLVNALIAHCGDSLSGIGGVRRPGIVHRLDRDTSGVMVAAKNDLAHTGLTEQFSAHSVERAYLALCWEAPRPRAGTVDAPLARSKSNRQKQAVVESGRRAVTHYEVQEVFGPPAQPVASLIECRLETGRTHQIRVHMTHIGHAVIGDPVYGRGKRAKGLSDEAQETIKSLGRQALHAGILGFVHPRTGETLTFSSPFPPELEHLKAVLRAHPTSQS